MNGWKLLTYYIINSNLKFIHSSPEIANILTFISYLFCQFPAKNIKIYMLNDVHRRIMVCIILYVLITII